MICPPAPLAAQMFLTPGALFVLVVDIFAYSEDGSSREDALEQWLDILQSRVPGSVVLLVGTHSDSFDSPAECSKRVGCFLKGELVSSTLLTFVRWQFSLLFTGRRWCIRVPFFFSTSRAVDFHISTPSSWSPPDRNCGAFTMSLSLYIGANSCALIIYGTYIHVNR